MDCKRYREWIEDAAAGTLVVGRSTELRVHLALCPACQATLERERALFAAIDRSFAASLEAEPSPGFAAGVRARISEGPRLSPAWFAQWTPLAVGALAATLVVGVWLAERQKAEGRKQEGVVSVTRLEKQKSEVRSQKPVNKRKGTEGTGHRSARGYQMQAASRRHHSNPGPDLEVLVPKGQAAAVMQLYNSVWDSHQELAAVVSRNQGADGELAPISSGLAPTPLEIKPLETPALDAELKPLSALDDTPENPDK